ncbi:hypothetical protein [Paenibacillus sp. PL2-23]|uniref:hypothetical protein n=1 Tax=Paenibacillus sp. PL2-23 TaxID=2100729 RepID=UPI0030F975F8
MTRAQRISIIVVASLAVLGLAAYGTVGLLAKINQVNQLNGQLSAADLASSSVAPDASPVPAASEPASGAEAEEGSAPAETTAPAASKRPASVETARPAPAFDKPAGQPAAPAATAAPTSSGGQAGGGASPAPDDASKRKAAIDGNVQADMEVLRAACSSKSAGLVADIKAELASNPDATIETITSQFLGKVALAEAECDAKFAGLVSDAKAQYQEAGLLASELPDWSTAYESAKVQARSKALVEIAGALQ